MDLNILAFLKISWFKVFTPRWKMDEDGRCCSQSVKVIFIQKKWASSSLISPTFPALPRNFFFFFLSFSFSFSFSWQALKSLNPQVPRGAIWCLRSRPPIPPIDSDMPFWSDIYENLEVRPISTGFFRPQIVQKASISGMHSEENSRVNPGVLGSQMIDPYGFLWGR